MVYENFTNGKFMVMTSKYSLWFMIFRIEKQKNYGLCLYGLQFQEDYGLWIGISTFKHIYCLWITISKNCGLQNTDYISKLFESDYGDNLADT